MPSSIVKQVKKKAKYLALKLYVRFPIIRKTERRINDGMKLFRQIRRDRSHDSVLIASATLRSFNTDPTTNEKPVLKQWDVTHWFVEQWHKRGMYRSDPTKASRHCAVFFEWLPSETLNSIWPAVMNTVQHNVWLSVVYSYATARDKKYCAFYPVSGSLVPRSCVFPPYAIGLVTEYVQDDDTDDNDFYNGPLSHVSSVHHQWNPECQVYTPLVC